MSESMINVWHTLRCSSIVRTLRHSTSDIPMFRTLRHSCPKHLHSDLCHDSSVILLQRHRDTLSVVSQIVQTWWDMSKVWGVTVTDLCDVEIRGLRVCQIWVPPDLTPKRLPLSKNSVFRPPKRHFLTPNHQKIGVYTKHYINSKMTLDPQKTCPKHPPLLLKRGPLVCISVPSPGKLRCKLKNVFFWPFFLCDPKNHDFFEFRDAVTKHYIDSKMNSSV